MPSKKNNNQSGNVFLFIFIGIILFATLSYTIARSMSSATTKTMSARKAKIITAELITYTQRIERAVSRIRIKGYSEVDISFADYNSAIYANSNCTDNGCRVFNIKGGGANTSSLPSSANVDWVDGVWEFHSGTEIDGVGTTCGTAACTELIATLHFTNENLCSMINDTLDIDTSDIPSTAQATNSLSTGDFTYSTTFGNVPASSDLFGQKTGCIQETTGCENAAGSTCYTFYHVLLAR